MKRAIRPSIHNLLVLLFFCVFSAGSFAKTIWVGKNGADSNGCTHAVTDACLTIQKGISLAVAGDTVNIGEGTYIENSASSPHVARCIWSGDRHGSLCVYQSGTRSSPITIQAAPGSEGRVVIDSQNQRLGIHLMHSDYIHIRGLRFINNHTIGIASWGQTENAVPIEDKLSIGVVVERNTILNTHGVAGDNISAIGMWSSRDWVVRNNYIDGVTAAGSTIASGIQSYGVINALVEHNYIANVGYGIFWKDHFVRHATNRGTWDEAEIRYNKISARDAGVLIGIRGENSPEAGANYIHHNIFYGIGDEGSGIRGSMSGAFRTSGALRIEHNLFDGEGRQGAAVVIDGHDPVTFIGNISTRTNMDLELIAYESNKLVKLTSSNYNVFDSSLNIGVDVYGSSLQAKYYTSLQNWRAVTASSAATLSLSNPDRNSITASASQLFDNLTDRNYRYRSNSPAIGLMPDGSNAGPYQFGNEIIGIIPENDRRPKPPVVN